MTAAELTAENVRLTAEVQRLSFALGNLSCTRNHVPPVVQMQQKNERLRAAVVHMAEVLEASASAELGIFAEESRKWARILRAALVEEQP